MQQGGLWGTAMSISAPTDFSDGFWLLRPPGAQPSILHVAWLQKWKHSNVKHHLSCYDLLEHSLSCWPVTHMEQHVAAEWWQLHPLQFPGLAPILTVEMLASEGGDRAQPLPPPVLACASQSMLATVP